MWQSRQWDRFRIRLERTLLRSKEAYQRHQVATPMGEVVNYPFVANGAERGIPTTSSGYADGEVVNYFVANGAERPQVE